MSIFFLSLYLITRKWGTELKIEQINLSQIEEIAVLFDGYRQFYQQESDLKGAVTFLTERLQNNESVIFAAKVQDDYAGFVQIFPIFSSVAMKQAYLLNDLFVAENYRRMGVAEQLMEAAFRYAEEQNARYLTLETAVKNVTAQALYEKVGMEVEDTVRHYIRYW